ncbi:hypothetical protein TNCV_375421 [Trichonephila clavipes]|nr:hypothetical protein TNCV_375421 [Trichonephila clavipes]
MAQSGLSVYLKKDFCQNTLHLQQSFSAFELLSEDISRSSEVPEVLFCKILQHMQDILEQWRNEEHLAVGSLVVRAPDSGPEGLGSMPVPPNTFRVHTDYVLVKISGSESLVG